MTVCDDCGEDTLEARTIINGEMQRLCSDCKVAVLENGEQDTQDTQDNADTSDTESPQDALKETHAVEPTAWDVSSIAEHWHANQVRLPEGLQRRYNAQHKRMEVQLLDSDREMSKDRHYKPLVIALGLARLKELDTDEIEAALDQLERVEHLEDFGN